MFDQLTYEDFCELVNTDFDVVGSEESNKLKLINVSEKKETQDYLCFTLLLKNFENMSPQQGLCKLKHDQHGEGDLFIVPIRQEDDGIVFEAVFNRMVKK